MTPEREPEPEAWPELDWARWRDTGDTLHRWTQIVGKTRLALAPMQGQWWNVALYVTPRGLSTSAMPWADGTLEIEFDLLADALRFTKSDGRSLTTPLRPQSVADFLAEYRASLDALGVDVPMDTLPCEIPDAVRFEDDRAHASYDGDAARRFLRVLTRVRRIFGEEAADFVGKISPVHFFWGSFDLAMTRFSGLSAPARPGASAMEREAYAQEVVSHGFWPGNGGFGEAAFYAYAVPTPDALKDARVEPPEARWDPDLGEFLLPYAALRAAPDPDAALRAFVRSTYAAAADLAGWDRATLERPAPRRPHL